MSRNKHATSHLNDGELLRYTDGELSSRESKRVRKHLEACWECRTQLDELQQTIGDCVRYRNAVSNQMPDPPAPWFDIRREFEQIDEREKQNHWAAQLWLGLSSLASRPRRWSVALATIVVAVLIVDQFRNAPSVQAAELLEKAAVAAQGETLSPRYIEIQSGTQTLTRAIGAAPASVEPNAEAETALRPLFERANYSWDDPLSASSFAAWRNSLAEKSDEVTTVGHRLAEGEKVYRIRTTTDASILTEATLQLTVSELRPLEGTYRFSGEPLVSIAALVAPPSLPEPESIAAAVPSAPARAINTIYDPAVVEDAIPVTPDEELQVLAALHRLGADLGAPVEVSRSESHVLVSGFGVDPSLGTAIQNELEGMPRVRIDLSTPTPLPAGISPAPVREASIDPEIEQLQARLEAELGGRAEYDQFTGEVLDLSDSLMSRVHALRRLSESFHPDDEAAMSVENRDLLNQLLREHATAAADLSARIETRVHPVLISLGATALTSDPELPPADTWQAATTVLLSRARRAEFLLGGILGGASTETSPQDLSTETLLSLTQLRIQATNYLENTIK